ncbi:MAG: hypothetical protein ABIZ80_17950, partial [Bryobacteraceae bacterium]
MQTAGDANSPFDAPAASASAQRSDICANSTRSPPDDGFFPLSLRGRAKTARVTHFERERRSGRTKRRWIRDVEVLFIVIR